MFLCALEDMVSCGLALSKIRHLTESDSEDIGLFALTIKYATMIIDLEIFT